MPEDTNLARVLLLLNLAHHAGFLDERSLYKAEKTVIHNIKNSDKADDIFAILPDGLLDPRVIRSLTSIVKSTPIGSLPEEPSYSKNRKTNGFLSHGALENTKPFGRYRILSEIGRGGMGVVYVAHDPSLHRTVALKTVSLDKESETLKKRFIREARLMASLKHPGIVSLYDVGFEDGLYYFTMEYIQGNNLSQYLVQNQPCLNEKIILIQKIADALGYAHSMGIIHRDIKPSNILVTTEGEPKLTDFGLGKKLDVDEQLTLSGTALGTPAYMSPEQALGKRKEVNFRSDVYSLGAVMYELLVDRPPFGQILLSEYIDIIQKEYPLPPSQLDQEIPREVDAVCLKCLEREPYKRYLNSSELALDLERYLNGEMISVHGGGRFIRIWKRIKTHRIILSYGIGLLTLILALLSWQIISKNIQKNKDVEEFYKCGLLYYEKGQYAQARESLHEVLARDARHGKALNILENISDEIKKNLSKAEETAQKQEWEKTLSIYQEILRKDPKNVRANEGREIAEVRLDAHNAYKLLEKENDLLVKEREEKERRAQAMIPYEDAMEIYYSPNLRKNELLRCTELLSEAIQKDNEFADAYFQRGRIYHRLSYLDKAISDYTRCTDLNDKLFAPKYYQARIWEIKFVDPSSPEEKKDAEKKLKELFNTPFSQESETGRYKEILHVFLVYIEHRIAHVERVQSYLDSFELSENLRTDYPLFPEAHFLTAEIGEKLVLLRCELEKGASSYYQLNMVFEAINRALALDPYNGAGYAQRGALYCTLWDFENAVKDFDMALKLNYTDMETYFLRSLSHMLLGNHKECLNDINEMIERWGEKKDGPLFYTYQGYYELLYGDLSKAEAALSRAIQSGSPEYVEKSNMKFIPVYLLRGVLYAKMREKQKAIEDFQVFLKVLEKFKLMDKWRPMIGLINTVKEERFIRNLKALQDPFTLYPQHKEDLFSLIPLIGTLIKSFPIGDNPSRTAMYQSILNRLEKDPSSLDLANMLSKEAGSPVSLIVLLYTMTAYFQVSMQERLTQINSELSVSNHYARASYYFCRRRWTQCQEDLEAVLDIDNQSMKAHYALATVLAILSEKEPSFKKRAIFHLKLALELGWEHPQWPLQDGHFKAIHQEKEFLQLIKNNTTRKSYTLKDLESEFKELYATKEWRDAMRALNSYRIMMKDKFDRATSLVAEK